jgi:hypothetical protein
MFKLGLAIGMWWYKPIIPVFKRQRQENQEFKASWVQVAHACNPSNSGGRDQEDGGLKPAQANSLRDPMLKNPSNKRAGGVAQSVEPESNPSTTNKKKNSWPGLGPWLKW